MEIWKNQGTPEDGLLIVRFGKDQRRLIDRAAKTFSSAETQSSLPPEVDVRIVQQSLAKFIGKRVFRYRDENSALQYEAVIDGEAVADTRDVLILHGNKHEAEREQSADLAGELFAKAVNVLGEYEQMQSVESQEQVLALS